MFPCNNDFSGQYQMGKSPRYQRENTSQNFRGDFTTEPDPVEKWIQPDIVASISPWATQPVVIDLTQFKPEFLSNIGNKTKETLLLPESIAKNVDEQLQLKISNDEYLRRVLVKSIEEIEKYLKKTRKKYKIKASVWHDIEDAEWEENTIFVKVECKDNKEKREIWDRIDEIVGKQEEHEVVILTNVDKYEFS